MANFCRSPVCEFFLDLRFNKDFNVSSYGLYPITSSGMDKRSYDFIRSKGYTPNIHNPKKLTKKLILEAQIVFAVDHVVLRELNKKYSKFKDKFKLFSYREPSKILYDPYNFNNEDYINVMEDIFSISKTIDL